MKLRGYKTITIYERPKNEVCSLDKATRRVIDINEECKYVHELGKDEYVQLVWTDVDCEPIQMGSVIAFHPYVMDDSDADLEDDSTLTPIYYFLTDTYEPTNVGENEWRYEPKFQSPIMLLDKIPFAAYFQRGDEVTLPTEFYAEYWGTATTWTDCDLANYITPYFTGGNVLGKCTTSGEFLRIKTGDSACTLTIRITTTSDSLGDATPYPKGSLDLSNPFYPEKLEGSESLYTYAYITPTSSSGRTVNLGAEDIMYGKMEKYTVNLKANTTYSLYANVATNATGSQYVTWYQDLSLAVDVTGTREFEWSMVGKPSHFLTMALQGICAECTTTYDVIDATDNFTGEFIDRAFNSNDTSTLYPTIKILVGVNEDALNETITFQNSSIFSAFSTIASTFDTEFTWMSYSYVLNSDGSYSISPNPIIFFGKVNFPMYNADSFTGSLTDYRKQVYELFANYDITDRTDGYSVQLTAGENCDNPQIQINDSDYHNRFYIYGSSRNISQTYGTLQNDGSYINRLSIRKAEVYDSDTGKTKTLDQPYLDATWEGASAEIASGMVQAQAVYFDDIYPHSNLVIQSICHDERYILDANSGEPTGDTYYVYFLQLMRQDNGESYIFPDNAQASSSDNPTIVFKSGLLAGYEFEFIWHKESGTSSSDYKTVTYPINSFELIFQQDNGVVVPGKSSLVPALDDEVTIAGIQMDTTYVESAQQELYEEGVKYIKELAINHNTYTVDCYPTAEGLDLANMQTLCVGARASLSYYNSSDKPQSFIEDGRVSKIERCLDFPTEMKVTICNSEIKGTTNALELSVQATNQEIADLQSQIDSIVSTAQSQLTSLYNSLMSQMSQSNIWSVETSGSVEYAYTKYPVVSNLNITAYGSTSSVSSWFNSTYFYFDNNGQLCINASALTSLSTYSADGTSLADEVETLKKKINELEEKLKG